MHAEIQDVSWMSRRHTTKSLQVEGLPSLDLVFTVYAGKIAHGNARASFTSRHP